MRIFTLGFILSLSIFRLFAQPGDTANRHAVPDALRSKLIRERIADRPNPFSNFKNQNNRIQIPVSVLKSPTLLAAFIHSSEAKAATTAGNSSKSITSRASILSSSGCMDSSYVKLIAINGNVLTVNSVMHTSDDGILISGYLFSSSIPNAVSQTNGLLLKTDNNGNVLWAKLFADKNLDYSYSVILMNSFELKNGDILATSLSSITDLSVPITYYKTTIYRLNAQGNMIWNRSLTPALPNTQQLSYPSFKGMAEGPDGSILLCGSNALNNSNCMAVVKMDANGNKLWDLNIGNNGDYNLGAEGVNVFMDNGRVVLVGISHGDDFTLCAICFLTLDYMTGATLNRRFFPLNYASVGVGLEKEFIPYNSYCTQLNNGHYIFYGNLFSDFNQAATPIDHFGVVEFDASQNFTGNSYTISSNISTYYENDNLFFNTNGDGVFDLFHWLSSLTVSDELFIGSMHNNQFAKQRVVLNNGISYGYTLIYSSGLFCYMNDGGYTLGQTYYSSGGYLNDKIELRRMHDADTSSVCMGRDTSFAFKLPFNIIENPNYHDLNNPLLNLLDTTEYPVAESDTLSWMSSSPCQIQSHCDTVKIHGQPAICASQQPALFTAFKNAACGSNIIWNIDSTAVDSIRYENDTTVAISFKNVSWQGNIYASLSNGTCPLPIGDSLHLYSTGNLRDSIQLGSDTIICNLKAYTLHAGNEFASYLWQDGSMDSIFSASSSGTYYVTAKDFCANTYSDTIHITFGNYYFSIGHDTSVCSGDSLNLTATPGFTNYQWSPEYNISTDTGVSVSVFPLTDTSYIATAMKLPGCYSSDTIHIEVLHAAPIHLGNDTSFCSGDSVVLNAGSGFLSYIWSNFNTTSSITLKAAGSYIVHATGFNSCISSDTFNVLQVFPNPVIQLAWDSLLCMNSSKLLDAGSGFSSYLWQNGDQSESISVSTIGTYWVKVIDHNGCIGTDTVRISRLLPNPAGFLPVDTSICNYSLFILQPLQPYVSYLWDNGSTASALSINTGGTYTLMVTDTNGCQGTDSTIVKINECLSGAYFPNAFSPNGDGHNDVFKPIMLGTLLSYHILIYNRWGQLVFESRDPAKGWNGNLGGVLQEVGTYVFNCSYQFAGSTPQNTKGTVVLVR